jgi:uncharacterized protein
MINWKRWGPSVTSGPERHSWPDMPEDLPVDILPASNEEYFPPRATREQLMIMRLAEKETERWRHKMGMSRAEFVRTAAAMVIGFWAIDLVRPGIFGSYGAVASAATTDACDLEYAGGKGLETLHNLPGEFIFDVQSHHVEPEGLWRMTNPALAAFFEAVFPQTKAVSGVDPIQNLSRYWYLKEIYLDSATSATVLSVVPTSPDTENPLPIAEASETIDLVNHLAASRHPHRKHARQIQPGGSTSASGDETLDTERAVMHAFVMPNRGSSGTANTATPSHPGGFSVPRKPRYFDQEMRLMHTRAARYRDKLRGWKTYCAWGDIPYTSGWYLDSDIGMEFLANVAHVSEKFPEVPPVVATHKGFALPGFDQRCSTPRDIGYAAKHNRKVRFLVYHSGYNIGDIQKPYAGDARARSDTNTVDALIKSLREHRYDATKFVARGHEFGNVPNVWAELGSVWRSVMDDPDQAANLLGKLITYVGPRRVCWGTDSLWYGSPQPEIIAMRRFEFTARGKEFYRLPHGMEGDREDPTRRAPRRERTIRNGILGYNAAEAYDFDPDFRSQAIRCDQLQKLKDEGYSSGDGLAQTASLRMNQIPGPRTRRAVLKSLTENPWSP